MSPHGRETHLHRDVGESGIEPGLGDGIQGRDSRRFKIHEVWHFPDKTERLFRGYIDMFLKKKQEASGWPGWCQTDQDKKKYLQEHKDKEGIELDRDVIEYNAGARTVWMQILNNFWGKIGQRPNRPKTKAVADPKYYFELLTSGGVEVTNVNLVNNEVVEMFYTMKDPFVEAAGNTNVVLAAFTTAQARITLYRVMRALGRRVCYYDTDSIIYTVKEGEWEPSLGDHLGELTNELDDNDWIVVFYHQGAQPTQDYQRQHGKGDCQSASRQTIQGCLRQTRDSTGLGHVTLRVLTCV